jgi:hypothetical protein
MATAEQLETVLPDEPVVVAPAGDPSSLGLLPRCRRAPAAIRSVRPS